MVSDPNHGWWVVAMTSMAAKTASLILQNACDQYRLWALSLHIVRLSREIDLLPVLGSQTTGTLSAWKSTSI